MEGKGRTAIRRKLKRILNNQEKLKKSNKIKVLTVSSLIAEAIGRIVKNKSISQLFS